MGRVDPAICLERAERHRQAGDVIAVERCEWAAVCWFYSAYHLVRAALIQDPVFDDVGRLKAFNLHLTPDDRYTERHRGRRGSKQPEFGINDLVSMLYPAATQSYERLHQASIGVRYGDGLKAGLNEIGGYLQAISTMSDAGGLVAVDA